MDRRRFVLGLACGAACAGPARAVRDDTGTWVAVMRRGDLFGIDAVMVVPVTPAQAWEVLTDFDNMAKFVPAMTASRVTARDGDVVRIEQRGELKWGPVIEAFETRREVRLKPHESLQWTSLAGEVPPEQGLTRLKAVPAGTEIWHRGELRLNTWMPTPVAERFLQGALQERYEAFAAEMRRRAAATVK
jgi:hypothetical protein